MKYFRAIKRKMLRRKYDKHETVQVSYITLSVDMPKEEKS